MAANTIGKVARRAGVGVETIRYYERRGLIEQPEKRASFREYPPGTVERLQFIRHAKDLGFTLREIGDLLSLRVDPRVNCDAVRERAESKIADIEQRVASLRKIHATLEKLVAACGKNEGTGDCPILESLH